MEQFKKQIKVNSETMQRLNIINEEYKKSGRILKFRDKVATTVYIALLDIETENESEKSEKLEFLNSLNKIICNYEYFKPLVSEYIARKSTSLERH